MADALAQARTAARNVDQRSGRETAVLGVEASQQAWQAYRDTACGSLAAFTDREAEADVLELACRIEQTAQRTQMLLRLAEQ